MVTINLTRKLMMLNLLKERKRAALNADNRKRGTYGNGDGKDVSHKKDGSTVLESMKINRARIGKSRKK
jgi:hypothetical protein